MTIGNNVQLTGNLGAEARIIEQQEGKNFAAFSLATADSYKGEDGQWITKEPVWHNCLAFSPAVIGHLKNLKKGTRVKVTGSLSYRAFETTDKISRREATIIVAKVEQAPLYRKSRS